MFQVLYFQGLVSSFSVANNVDMYENEEEIAQARVRLLKRMDHNGELETLWWWTSADISVLKFKESEREEDGIVVEGCSLLQSSVTAVRGYSAEECTETLTLVRTEVGEQSLQDFLGYHRTEKEGSYVERAFMFLVSSILSWDFHMLFNEKEKYGAYRQVVYADTYRRTVEPAKW